MTITIDKLARTYDHGGRIVINPNDLICLVEGYESNENFDTVFLTAVIASVPLVYGYWKHVKRLYKTLETKEDSGKLVGTLIARFEDKTQTPANKLIKFSDAGAWVLPLDKIVEAYENGETVVITADGLDRIVDAVEGGRQFNERMLLEIVVRVPLRLHAYYWANDSLYKAIVDRLAVVLENNNSYSGLAAKVRAKLESRKTRWRSPRSQFEFPDISGRVARYPSDATMNYMRRRARRFLHKIMKESPGDYVELAIVILNNDIQAENIWKSWLHCDIAMGSSRQLRQASHSRGHMHFPRKWSRDCKRRERFKNRWNNRRDEIAAWLEFGSLMRAEFAARIYLDQDEVTVNLSDERLRTFLESVNTPLIQIATLVFEKDPHRIRRQTSASLAKALVTLDPRERERLWIACGEGRLAPARGNEFASQLDASTFWLGDSYSRTSTGGERLLGMTSNEINERCLWGLRVSKSTQRSSVREEIIRTALCSRTSAWGESAWQLYGGWYRLWNLSRSESCLADSRISLLRPASYIEGYIEAATSTRICALISTQFEHHFAWTFYPPVLPPWFNKILAKELILRVHAGSLDELVRSEAIKAVVDLARNGHRPCKRDDLNKLIPLMQTEDFFKLYVRAAGLEYHWSTSLSFEPALPMWLAKTAAIELFSRLRSDQISKSSLQPAIGILVDLARQGCVITTRDEITQLALTLNGERLANLLYRPGLPRWLAKAVAPELLTRLVSEDLDESLQQKTIQVLIDVARRGVKANKRSDIKALLSRMELGALFELSGEDDFPGWLAKFAVRELVTRMREGEIEGPLSGLVIDAVLNLVSNGHVSGDSPEFKALLRALDTEELLDLFVGMPDDTWQSVMHGGNNIPTQSLASNDFLQSAWRRLAQDDEDQMVRRECLLQRIFGSPLLLPRHVSRLDLSKASSFNDDQSNLVTKWLRDGYLSPRMGSDELLAFCTNTNISLHEAALTYVVNAGLDDRFSLQLMESRFPPAIELSENHFTNVDLNGRQALQLGLMFCDSPVKEVHDFGLLFIERHWDTISITALVRSLAESTDTGPRLFVAKLATERKDLGKFLETFDTELLAERNRHRGAKDFVKLRHMETPNSPEKVTRLRQPAESYLNAVIDLAHGTVKQDKDWALSELVKLKRAGASVPELDIRGPQEDC